MDLSQWLLPEFDREMANTRKVLERVPEDRPEFKPHARSMTLARLAGHVSELPTWAERTLTTDSLDIAPIGAPPQRSYTMTSQQDMLDRFDRNVSTARAAIAAASDADFAAAWTLVKGGHKVFAIPRSAVLRNMVLNHMIHHRAQLGVYLRLNNVPLPPLYGPSADEGGY